MSTATGATRRVSFGTLLTTIFKHTVVSTLKSRKTVFLGLAMLLPVLGAGLYLSGGGASGVDIYTKLVDHAVVTFLLPLVCLFYGGPTVVEEIEGRTATYLFLRPVSKPAIFLGKYLAAAVSALVVVLIPLVPTYLLCMAAGGDVGENFKFFLQTFISVGVGCLSYTAVFAALSAAFARSILAGVLFWIVVEAGLSFIPVLEFATQKFHLLNAGNLIDVNDIGMLDRMVLGADPIVVPIWGSFMALGATTVLALVVGSWLFNDRQYII